MQTDAITSIIIHSKYFSVSDWLKARHNSPLPATVDQIWKKFGITICHWSKSLTGFKLCATTLNNTHKYATGFANGPNMYVTPKNVRKTFWQTMFRQFVLILIPGRVEMHGIQAIFHGFVIRLSQSGIYQFFMTFKLKSVGK